MYTFLKKELSSSRLDGLPDSRRAGGGQPPLPAAQMPPAAGRPPRTGASWKGGAPDEDRGDSPLGGGPAAFASKQAGRITAEDLNTAMPCNLTQTANRRKRRGAKPGSYGAQALCQPSR